MYLQQKEHDHFFPDTFGLLHTIRLVLYFRKITRGEERIKLSQSPGRNQKNVRKRKKIFSLANHDFLIRVDNFQYMPFRYFFFQKIAYQGRIGVDC